MTYVSPIDIPTEDPELVALDKAGEMREEKFDFSMFFILGLILILIGFFRMLFIREMDWVNIGFIALGFVTSLSSQTWLRAKKLTAKEKDLIKRKIEIQYELADGDTGFTDQDVRNQKRQEYLAELEKQGIMPDVKHKEKYVNANEQAAYESEERFER